MRPQVGRGHGSDHSFPQVHNRLRSGCSAVYADDGFLCWRDGALAVDSGFPVVVVHHQAAEIRHYEPGEIAARACNCAVHHIAQKCPFWSVHPDTTGDR